MEQQEKLREGIIERPDALYDCGTLRQRSTDDYHSGGSVVNRKLTTVRPLVVHVVPRPLSDGFPLPLRYSRHDC